MKKKALVSIFFVICISFLVNFHFRGAVYYDEGYILNSALRIAHGQIPYKDFDMVYTPISFLYTSGFLKLFGETVFAGRLAALSISVLSLFALYQILRIITKNNILIVFSLFFFIVWGPAHINFPWPTMFAECFFLFTLFFYLQGLTKKSNRYFQLAGIAAIITFLSKQNFGVGLILVLLLYSFFIKDKAKITYVKNFILGIIFATLIGLLFFFVTTSLPAFFQNMYVYTLKRVMIQKTLDTPFIYYHDAFLIKSLKFIFYLSPIILSSIAFFILRKSKNQLLIIPISVGIFYILGVRPTTDYNHVVPLIAISSLSIAAIINFSKKFYIKYSFYAVLILGITLGFHGAYFRSYYKWDPPLQHHTTLVKDSRLYIYLEESRIKESDDLLRYIEKKVKPDEYIFVNYYAPLIYFISARKNPTRFDLVSPSDTQELSQKEMINDLQTKNVPLIIMSTLNKNEQSLTSDFIRKTYPVKTVIGGFIVLTKK